MSEFKISNGIDELTLRTGDKDSIVDIVFMDGSNLYDEVCFYLDLIQCQELVNFLKNKIAIHHASTGNQ